MKLIINIQKKYFFVLLTLVLSILVIIFVEAFSNLPTFPNKASSFGHSVDEIDWRHIQNTLWLGKSGEDLNSPTLYLKAYSPLIHVQDRSNEEYYIQTLADSLRIFRRTNPEKDDLVISNSNLGIDVSNPLDRLHVNGPIKFGEGAILEVVEWDGVNHNPQCSSGFTALFRSYEGTVGPAGGQGGRCIGEKPFAGNCDDIRSCGQLLGWQLALEPPYCIYYDRCTIQRRCFSSLWTRAVCIKGAT